jgi:hypothetical protein
MSKSISQAVREACLWLPEATEVVSHGSTAFKVRGKIFAYYLVNHHGDGRVALWLNAPRGTQESHVTADPKRFFVPPYLGPRGWLGVELDRGLSWQRIAQLVREAYEKTAPAALVRVVGEPPTIGSPRRLAAAEKDPLQSPRGKALLKTLRAVCLGFPESREALQFGYPAWQAGRRTFALARGADGLAACFWVGIERQLLLTTDARYRIPPYLGHNGWIALDATAGCDPDEIESLATHSYRHFALKRMRDALDGGNPSSRVK